MRALFIVATCIGEKPPWYEWTGRGGGRAMVVGGVGVGVIEVPGPSQKVVVLQRELPQSLNTTDRQEGAGLHTHVQVLGTFSLN